MVNRLAISFTSAELASHGFTLSQAPILILSSNCRVRNVHHNSCKICTPKPASQPISSTRRQLLFLLTSSTALATREAPSIAEECGGGGCGDCEGRVRGRGERTRNSRERG
ncbi:hypothetical protein HS088_TW14G00229 [Tripterygium wilfordii]|uniref:Uncharacterized protein n=1 Tax=Tripterygium wilfordii TaxID=458696 RepID=A0A7J7CPR6_TRIWF|nr:hypothetical protein HS088_TW14G00229 [Tripterygium wilfordii]